MIYDRFRLRPLPPMKQAQTRTRANFRSELDMSVREFQTKNQIIYQDLKKAIIGGKFKPMERIVISEVARQFGSSELPGREALKKLEADGLIHNKPYVGCKVTNLSL